MIPGAAGLAAARQPSLMTLTHAPSMTAPRASRRPSSARAGVTDRTSLAERVAELHPASFAWALVCCGGRAAEAEDVLQTVYCKIVDGRARFGGRAKLKTWLFSVIRRTAADRARRRTLRRLLLEGRWRRQPPPTVDEATPEALALASDRDSFVRRALQALSPRQRRMLELVFYHDHSVRQAAEVLGLRLGTARVHYQRGKQMLARRFEEEANRART